MIDTPFAEFMQTNFAAVDELSRRFIEYRVAVVERYVDEVRVKIKAATPSGYSFGFGGQKRFSERGDHAIGWKGVLDVNNVRVPMMIAFGFYHECNSLVDATKWPLASQCYTGLRTLSPLPPNFLQNFLAAAQQAGIGIERSEPAWPLWHYWDPFWGKSTQGLHERLTGHERSNDQDVIIEDLRQWKERLEGILAMLSAQLRQ